MKVISFRDNVGARHGDVLRSSAIFYVRENEHMKSTVSFMNYWKLKRGLDVALVASTRAMTGELLHRERLSFGKGEVINYRAPVAAPFEGSVEIEVFSTQNMAIPYSAIVCLYETPRGYTMVHGYARAYSQHEIEEGRTLTVGREACWTLRDTALQRSFGIVHNGSLACPAQPVTLTVRNHRQQAQTVTLDWPALRPYETRVVRPQDHLSNLVAWLGGQPGQAKIDFELGAGFTRMLVGTERLDGSDMQVTHSNFDYGRQPTDMAEPGQRAYMHVPLCPDVPMQLLVYPDAHAGDYCVKTSQGALAFSSGQTLWADAPKGESIVFERSDGPLPTRIVTALQVRGDAERIPGECSLGVLTALQPTKRLWWGSVASPGVAASKLVLHDLPEIYGGLPVDADLFFSLHSAHHPEPIKATLKGDQLEALSQGMATEAIWPEAHAHLGGEAGYYTMFCAYGGLTAYTLTRNAHGSVCLEHGF